MERTGLVTPSSCRRSKGGMPGRTLRGEPQGPKGSQGTRLRLTKAVKEGTSAPPPAHPPTPKPPPSVICMLEKQRQDSTERAAAFIFSIPPVPSVVRGKYLTLLRAGPPAPLPPPPQQDLRCIICDETFAPGLHGLIGIYLGIFTASISQFPPSTLPSGHPRECLIALENVLTVDSL